MVSATGRANLTVSQAGGTYSGGTTTTSGFSRLTPERRTIHTANAPQIHLPGDATEAAVSGAAAGDLDPGSAAGGTVAARNMAMPAPGGNNNGSVTSQGPENSFLKKFGFKLGKK